ncbi:MAG: DNA polymerase, partial [bacterium]
RVIKAGIDLHALTATRLYGKAFTDEHRNLAKRAGFGRIYGAGAFTVALQTGVDEATAKKALAVFDKTFPGIRIYARKLSMGSEVVTPFGRTIPVDTQRPWGAINYAVQSTARDVFMSGMLRMVEAGFGQYLWLPVHDELIACVPESIAADAIRCMTAVMADDFQGVPIVADGGLMGRRWTKGTVDLAA